MPIEASALEDVLLDATSRRSLHDMNYTSRTPCKKTWQEPRRRVSVLAEMALRRERVVERLTELREQHNLTQEQAAQRVGITTRQWQRWESGESMPYPKSLDSVASKFGITVQEFFDGDPELGPGQLDRIEAKLDAILAYLSRTDSPAEVLEAEALRLDGQRKRTAGASKRTPRKATGG